MIYQNGQLLAHIYLVSMYIQIIKRIEYSLVVIISIHLLFITGCNKAAINSPPEVSTVGISLITPVSASCTGTVKINNSTGFAKTGFCWSTEQSPSVSDSRAAETECTVSRYFSGDLTGLLSNTTYYVRTYAINDAGTTYGNELSFTTPVDHTGETGSVTDINGNVYKTTGIGSQIWTAENMRNIMLNDSTDILLEICYRCWNSLTSPGYCWYDNDENNSQNSYGALYNWYAVNSAKLCPAGWHVPSDKEWTILETYLGGSDVAGGKLKESGDAHWKSPNTDATNKSGFESVPGGYRGDYAIYLNMGEESIFWTSTLATSDQAIYRALNCNSSEVTKGTYSINWGASVRCVKD
jgi:uncharacterized protein (TIGR02145 family)